MSKPRPRASLAETRTAIWVPPARRPARTPEPAALFVRGDSGDLPTVVRVRREPPWRPGPLVWAAVIVLASLAGLALALLARAGSFPLP